jgi:hypothetical protein
MSGVPAGYDWAYRDGAAVGLIPIIGASDQALSTLHVERHPCDAASTTGSFADSRKPGPGRVDRLVDEACGISLDDAVSLAFDAVPR